MMPTKPIKKSKPEPKQSNSLLAIARKSADSFRPKTKTWMDHLLAKHPKVAKELHAMGLDWISGGEARDLFPSVSAFHRFVDAKVFQVSHDAFRKWVRALEDSQNGK
jgi:hypothetical protein